MNTGNYHFKVGNFECTAVSDGTFTYAPPLFPPPKILLFANAPRELLEQKLRQHKMSPEQWGEWTSPYICLLVKTGKHVVLVDTGADGLAPSTGKLLKSLRAEQIVPEDVDTVILTHGHPDHIGGNTDVKGKPAFPNARYVMWKSEWDFWTSGKAEQTLDEHSREVLTRFAYQNLPPIQGQLELVERETEIVSGVRVTGAPGHTPGHMALTISSEDEQLLCIADTVLHPIHVEHPEWHAVFDLVPEQVMATRRKLLNVAAKEKALVLAFHFPFPGLGRIVQKGEAWRWQPIGTQS